MPLPLHSPQTSSAPATAPRLLPLPPTISIVQTWKVTMGRKSNGPT